MTEVIAQLPDKTQVADEKGQLQSGTRFFQWARQITELQIVSGVGSPEGVLEAKQKTLYMDETGASGSILYIKRDADIGGDRSQGWILV